MSDQMNISLMTVLQGYQILEARGIIESQPRSGYFVRPNYLWNLNRTLYLPEAKTFPLKLKASKVCVSGTVDSLFDEADRPGVLRLGCGIPDPDYFPSEELSLHMARTVRSHPSKVNRYSLAPGDFNLRLQISKKLMDSGCTLDPDDILITSGTISGIILCLRTITKPGDLVAVESPGFFGFFKALEHLSLRAVEVPTNPQTGLCLNSFEKLLRSKSKIQALILCPNVSNPTGATMPDENKQKLIEMADKSLVPIIEDDTYGEICFNSKRNKSLKAFDFDNVLQVGGFDKTLAPGYRIGWAIGGRYHQDVIKHHRMAYISTALPNQKTIASFLAEGSMNRHLRRLRKTYSENISLFQREIANCFPEHTQISNPTGGHFLWIEMPKGFDSVELSRMTIKHGISICPGVIFSSQQHYRNYFRLTCALPWSKQVEKAIHKIAELSLNMLKSI
jgi:DNA-binding transcriptional MocR family regulator